MNILFAIALIIAALVTYGFFATNVENNFQRQVGLTPYHNERQREPL